MIRFGYEAISWQEASSAYVGRIDHILPVLSACGFAGVEPETCMLGSFLRDPEGLKGLLEENAVSLAAICYPEHWRGDGETDEEKARAREVVALLSQLPGTLLQLCPRSGKDRANLQERQANSIRCMNNVARRAAGAGISCAVHPNFPPGSAFRTNEDYSVLADGLDSNVVGLVGEVGNMVLAGMDPLETLRQYRQLIRHVHLKDLTPTGDWCEMGKGVVDFPAIVHYLKDTAYDGWVIIDELSNAALADPDGSAQRDAAYVRDVLQPLTRE